MEKNNARNYYRTFIALKQERPEYAKQGREALGRCVIEARGAEGRIACYVQDLKPDAQYKLYIISASADKSAGVCAGTLHIDEKGRGETRFLFNANDVFGSGSAVENFNVAAVIAGPKFETELITPLAGYKDANFIMWKPNFVIASSVKDSKKDPIKDLAKDSVIKNITEVIQESADPVIAAPERAPEIIDESESAEAEPAAAPVSETVHEPDPVLEPVKPAERKKPSVRTKKTAAIPEAKTDEQADSEKDAPYGDNYSQNIDADNKTGAVSNNPHAAFKAMAKKFNEELEALSKYTSNGYDGMSDAADGAIDFSAAPEERASAEDWQYGADMIFIKNTPMFPFSNQKSDIKWVRTSPAELPAFPFNYIKYINHPFIQNAYKKYKHLIIGKTDIEGQTRYILGAPDVYAAEYRKNAAELGFRQFKSCSGILAEGEHGYWLLVM